MNNYKIKASVEAVSLFGDLGYDVSGLSKESEFLFAKSEDMSVYNYVLEEKGYKELTLPQLRDLVVLHRNDVKDATHDGTIHKYYKAESTWYYFDAPCERWIESTGGKQEFYNKLTPIQPEPEQGLISGADALRALADGKEVQGSLDLKLWANAREYGLDEFLNPNTSFKFRLKPRTITLSLEIPAPFEPKEGEKYWHLYAECKSGYDFEHYGYGDDWSNLGAWRTEEEIKQVVAALRGIKG